ncbi:MAG: DUF6232 family protein [Micromonosporaceae bacterium]
MTDDVTVTETWLVIGKRRLLVKELRNPQVGRARGSRTPATVAIAALLLPVVTLILGTNVTGWVTVGLGTLAALCVAAALRLGDSPPLVLHARYRGVSGPIFWSRDERVFGQVSRAVLRAHEAARHP